ncbi:major facilitator superfamily domain-containing protein [Daedaleopsis nitida]|nr:major facilitator superfamily domain-containing protein [Daedaleopsis nitida]
MADVEKFAERSMDDEHNYETATAVTTREDDTSSHKATSPVGAPRDAFPDGGMDAWFTVFGAFLALFCTFGQLNAFGTFQTWYAEHQLSHLPPSTIAWIGSLQLWIFFFSGGFIGRVFDAYGPRVIMIPGTVVLVFSIMMTSLSSQYYQYILAQGVLFGLGVGMIFYPSLSAISTYFSKYRGTALGIAFAGSGAGGVVYPIMFQQLFSRVGFAWAVRISGFISLFCCVAAIFTVTSRRGTAAPQSAPWLDTKIFRDAPFMLVVIGSIFVCLGLFIPFFYIADYARDHDISANTAFYIISAMNGAASWGVSRHRSFSILLFAILYGFLSGAFIAMLIPCVAQISEGEKIKEIGTRIGVLYSIISFA